MNVTFEQGLKTTVTEQRERESSYLPHESLKTILKWDGLLCVFNWLNGSYIYNYELIRYLYRFLLHWGVGGGGGVAAGTCHWVKASSRTTIQTPIIWNSHFWHLWFIQTSKENGKRLPMSKSAVTIVAMPDASVATLWRKKYCAEQSRSSSAQFS